MADGQPSVGSAGDGTYHSQISSIQQIFARFDNEGSGRVMLDRVPDLISALGRDARAGLEVQKRLRHEASAGDKSLVTFEEVVQTLKSVEEAATQNVEAEMTTPLTLLKRLDAYCKRCEQTGEYVEAQKARRKYEELREKEEERQLQLVEQAQRHEMAEVEEAQKKQFLGFSAAWDKYMADYESTAYMSLERLKEQHAVEFAQFQEKLRSQMKSCKLSRELLELRRKQEQLAKMNRYEEAWRVKEAGDNLEEWELARSASLVSDSARRAEMQQRQQQQKALAALLKRVQRDRGEQIRHRQQDSQRLIQRNKNLKVDLAKKQHLEYQRAEAAIKSILSQPEHAQKLLDENDPAFVARSAAMGELPVLGKIRWRGPALPENYQPPGGISKGIVPSRAQMERRMEQNAPVAVA
eukprot:TRINITY_DN31907_c0_g1_i1.p1 TRINITY_DN31907_c0_g1~~TRINITY_DN31907_c0_g1_i1.p1  ORF type:complete len:438 (+),score=143.45 TRINITY_DN31907_c0_g1_i1:86-1315(+)